MGGDGLEGQKVLSQEGSNVEAKTLQKGKCQKKGRR
jgi:hypothetical protein